METPKKKPATAKERAKAAEEIPPHSSPLAISRSMTMNTTTARKNPVIGTACGYSAGPTQSRPGAVYRRTQCPRQCCW